jgi:hypothetical protein
VSVVCSERLRRGGVAVAAAWAGEAEGEADCCNIRVRWHSVCGGFGGGKYIHRISMAAEATNAMINRCCCFILRWISFHGSYSPAQNG